MILIDMSARSMRNRIFEWRCKINRKTWKSRFFNPLKEVRPWARWAPVPSQADSHTRQLRCQQLARTGCAPGRRVDSRRRSAHVAAATDVLETSPSAETDAWRQCRQRARRREGREMVRSEKKEETHVPRLNVSFVQLHWRIGCHIRPPDKQTVAEKKDYL